MPLIKIKNQKSLINAILSIDNSFVFTNKKEMTEKLNIVGFFEDENNNHDDLFFNYFWFDGFIGDIPIALVFNNGKHEKKCNLLEKFFYKIINKEKVPHRENDLPAFISYHYYTNAGEPFELHYYIDGIPKRLDKSLAPFITIQNDNTTIHDYLKIDEKEDSISINKIISKDNDSVEIIVNCGSKKVSLSVLIAIVPRVENFDREKITNLNNELTNEEKTIIRMALI